MTQEDLQENTTVWDTDAPQFGQGVVLKHEDDMLEVYYPNIEETVNYSTKEALKYLNLVEL